MLSLKKHGPVILGLGVILFIGAALWAAGQLKINFNVTGNKVTFFAAQENQNPYLYSPANLALQKKLNRVLSFNLQNYTNIQENGFWNQETVNAINQFRDMYYKKYHLQRYYAFSASGQPNMNAVDDLLDRELPNPANFQRQNQRMMELKAAEPNQYYGHNARNELYRIEKGLNGDFIDPVSGEFSKSINLYTSPAANDHLIPIQLTARYSSQFAGMMGLGTGWYLTEFASAWFSYEKKEIILQDEKGYSQKFLLNNTGQQTLTPDTTRTDGGYFLKAEILNGDLGIAGSTILLTTASGNTLSFESLENSGGDNIESIVSNINAVDTIYGYTITYDNRGGFLYEPVTNTNSAGAITSISTNTNKNYNYQIMNGGIYDHAFKAVQNLSDASFWDSKSETIIASRMIINKDTLIGIVRGLKNSAENGWSVSFYAAPKAITRPVVMTNISQGFAGTMQLTFPIIEPEIMSQGKIYSFRRNGMGEPNVYAGYFLKRMSNRFQAYKEYGYNSDHKLCSIQTFSPSGTMADQITLTYKDSAEVDTDPDKQKQIVQKLPLSEIQQGQVLSPIHLSFNYNEANTELLSLIKHNEYGAVTNLFAYNTKLMENISAEDKQKIRDNLIKSWTDLNQAIKDLDFNINTLEAQKENYARNESTVLDSENSETGVDKKKIENADQKGYKKFKTDISYWNLKIFQLRANLSDMRVNLQKVSDQLSDFDHGKMMTYGALLEEISENGVFKSKISYDKLDKTVLNITNIEGTYRSVSILLPDGRAGFQYDKGHTVFISPTSNRFEFWYDSTLTNYNDRRVTKILYPDLSTVSLGYEVKGNIASVVNELGNSYAYTYDGAGNVLTKNLPGSLSWSFRYNDSNAMFLNRPTEINQPDGSKYLMDYDSLGEMTKQTVIGQDGTAKIVSAVNFAQNQDGSYSKNVTDLFQQTTRYHYDSDHNLRSVILPDNTTNSYTTDVLGKTLNEIRGNMVTYTTLYDREGRVQKQSMGASISRNIYNSLGYRVMSIDPLNNTNVYYYTPSGRLAKTAMPDSSAILYQYDADGNLKLEDYGFQGGVKRSTAYTYNDRGWLDTKKMYAGPEFYTYSYGYNDLGALILQIYYNISNTIDSKITYTYNGIGLVTNQFDLLSGRTLSYAYDSLSRIVRESSSTGTDTYTKISSYDLLGRQTGVTASYRGTTATLVSNIYRNDHSIVKLDQWGNASTNYLDYRNNTTNLVYSVFDPVTKSNVLHEHQYFFDALGNKVREIYPDKTVQLWQYYNGSWLARESKRTIDEKNAEYKEYRYDNAGRLTEMIDFKGQSVKRAYNNLGYLSSEEDALQNKVEYTTDLFGNVIRQKQGDRIKTMRYNALNKPVEATYPDLSRDLMGYNSLGSTTLSIPGAVSAYATVARYDSEGRKLFEKSPSGLETTTEYNAQGLVIRQGFTGYKNPVQKTGRISREVLSEYDVYGRLVRETTADGRSVVYSYRKQSDGTMLTLKAGPGFDKDVLKDASDKALSGTITGGIHLEAAYSDQMDRVIKTVLPDPEFTTLHDLEYYSGPGIVSGKVFNTAGFACRDILPGNRMTSYGFTADGKVSAETNALGEFKLYSYDDNGNLTNLQDFDRNSYRYTYDANNRLSATVNPGGNIETSYVYNAKGLIESKTVSGSGTIRYEYSARDKLIKEINPKGAVSLYAYNPAGFKINVQSPDGMEINYSYSEQGIPLGFTRRDTGSGTAYTTLLSIDSFGFTNRIENPDHSFAEFNMDRAGRIITNRVSANDGKIQDLITIYQYNDAGQLALTTQPDGLQSGAEYYQSGLEKTIYFVTNGIRIRETKTSYRLPGRPETESQTLYSVVEKQTYPDGITRYQYFDSLGRTTNTVLQAGNTTRNLFTQYGYKDFDNMHCRTVQSWKDNELDWNQEIRDYKGNVLSKNRKFKGAVAQTYQAHFNTIGQLEFEKSWIDKDRFGQTTYTYNSFGELSDMTSAAGLHTRFVYDNVGRLIQKTENENRVTAYQYNGFGYQTRIDKQGLASVTNAFDYQGNLIFEEDLNTQAKKTSVYDPLGRKTSEYRTLGSLTLSQAFVYDNMGRVVSATNELGGVIDTTYNLLGQKLTETKRWKDKKGGWQSLSVTMEYNSNGTVHKKTEKGKTLFSEMLVDQANFIEYFYDSFGNLTQTLYPDQSVTKSSYDSWGRKTNTIDQSGFITTVNYDNYGQVTSSLTETPGGVLVSTNEYNLAGLSIYQAVYDRNTPNVKRANAFSYDAAGRVITKTAYSDSGETISKTTEYNVFGGTTVESDYLGNKARTEFDSWGRPIRSIDHMGHVSETSYTYDNNHYYTETRSTVLNGKVIQTVTRTDGLGFKRSETDANGNTTIYEQNIPEFGKEVRITDKRGNQTLISYDSFERQIESKDANQKTLNTVYDSFGNKIVLIDKENRAMTNEYDWAGRVIRSIDALGNESQSSYGFSTITLPGLMADRKVEIEEDLDAEHRPVTTYRYGKLVLAVDPNNRVKYRTRYVYNVFGEKIQAVQPNGNTTKLTYNTFGNKTSETTPQGIKTSYTFNANGNVITETNPEGSISTTYNGNGLPTAKTYSDGNVKHFEYNALDRVVNAYDKYSSYSYSYDNNGNLLSRTDNNTKEVLSYTYDANANRKSMTTKGRSVFYEYDALDQIQRELTAFQGITNLTVSYLYSAMGRLTNKTFSTGVKTSYEYDGIYRLKKISNYTNASANPQLLSILEYNYDRVGNRTNEVETGFKRNGLPQVKVSGFVYDEYYRLIGASYYNEMQEVFTYDADNNRLTKTTSHFETKITTNDSIISTNQVEVKDTTRYVYDGDNRLLLESLDSGPGYRYTYDNYGRLKKKEGNGKTELYQYNTRDEVTQYTSTTLGDNFVKNTVTTKYTYDVNNLRIAKTDTSTAPGTMDGLRHFVYDGENLLFEGGTFYLNNIMANGYEAEINTASIAAYTKDANGSIRGEIYDRPVPIPNGMKDGSGNPRTYQMKLFSYTAFGEALESSSDSPFTDNKAKDGISYAGSYYDNESKLYYVFSRYYMADTGRFISMDPTANQDFRYSPAGLNRYIYGINNPCSFVDINGENPLAIFGAIAGFIVGGAAAIIAGKDVGTVFLSAFAGAAVGALAGFTFGASLAAFTTVAAGTSLAVGSAGAITAGTVIGGAIAGTAAGAVGAFGNAFANSAIIQGRGFDDSLQAGGQAAVEGAVTGAIGGAVGSFASGLMVSGGNLTDLQRLGNFAISTGTSALGGGLAGGASSLINGRDFATGFFRGALVGGASGAFASLGSSIKFDNIEKTALNRTIFSGAAGMLKGGISAAVYGGNGLESMIRSAANDTMGEVGHYAEAKQKEQDYYAYLQLLKEDELKGKTFAFNQMGKAANAGVEFNHAHFMTANGGVLSENGQWSAPILPNRPRFTLNNVQNNPNIYLPSNQQISTPRVAQPMLQLYNVGNGFSSLPTQTMNGNFFYGDHFSSLDAYYTNQVAAYTRTAIGFATIAATTALTVGTLGLGTLALGSASAATMYGIQAGGYALSAYSAYSLYQRATDGTPMSWDKAGWMGAEALGAWPLVGKGLNVTLTAINNFRAMSKQYAPVFGLGMSWSDQRALMSSLGENDIVAMRGMPLSGYIGRLFAPSKGPLVHDTMSFPFGVRVDKATGLVSISDADMAYYLKNGKVANYDEVMDFIDSANGKLSKKMIMHPDNHQGIIKMNEGALRVMGQNKPIYVFSKNGYLEQGYYFNMSKKYIPSFMDDIESIPSYYLPGGGY